MTVDQCPSTILSGLALAELQAQVDAFDHIYNTQRPHQGLPGRVTPLTAWQATAKTEAPRPIREQIARLRVHPRIHRPRTAPVPADLPPDTVVKKLTSAGVVYLNKVQYMVGAQHRFQQVLVITDGDKITITDLEGKILIEHTRPAPGIAYVGNAKPPGSRTDTPRTSPKS